MKIYKDVPEQFHSRYMDTIDRLASGKEEKKITSFRTKKMIPLVAAAVLALSTLTVSAACVFMWHQAAKDSLGVSDELSLKMAEEGIAKEEEVIVSAAGVEIRAIQTVMTGDYCYVLLSVTTPEEVVVDEDTLFNEMWVESDAEFGGCAVNKVPGSETGTNTLWEAKLLTYGIENYGGVDATICLKNLVQTEKTELVETLVEGEWQIPITLPSEPEVLAVHEEQVMQIGYHEVTIKRMEVTPFEIRLYGDKDELQHAVRNINQEVVGVYYQDGTFVEQISSVNYTKGHTDEETGEYYVVVELLTAIDTAQFSRLSLEEREELPGAMSFAEDELARMTVLYERHGHKLLNSGEAVVIWDELCGRGTEIVNLTELGYNEENGDKMEVGPGGNLLHVTIGTETQYFQVEY